MPSLIFLRKMLATLDRARRENRPYWFALTVPIAVAKAAGRHLGRPPKMSGQQIAEARARVAGDEPVRVVARAYGVSDKTLRATLARARPTIRG